MGEQLQHQFHYLCALNRCEMGFNFMYPNAASTLNEPVNDLLPTTDSLTLLSAMDEFAIEIPFCSKSLLFSAT